MKTGSTCDMRGGVTGRAKWLLVCLVAAILLALFPAAPAAYADEADGSDEAGLMATDISGATIAGIEEGYSWTGREVLPRPVVIVGGLVLAWGTDYSLAYQNNINEGTATIVVTGEGAYTGTVTAFFQIGKDAYIEPTHSLLTVFAGSGRYETARMIAKAEHEANDYKAYKGVIVASGEDGRFADALSAAGLAGMLDYPIVLTNGSAGSLGALTKSAIAELSNGETLQIIVVGGEPTVSAGIAQELEGYGAVTRLGGADRFETNALIYEYGVKNGAWNKDWAIIATGSNFADALSISGYASAKRAPVFLVDSKAKALPAPIESSLNGYGNVLILGSESSVSSGVYAGAQKAVGSGKVERLGGANRYETSAACAKWQRDHNMILFKAGFATGEKFPDALASGFLIGKTGGVLVLMNPDPSANSAAVSLLTPKDGGSPEFDNIKIFGSEASVPAAVRTQIITAMGWKEYQAVIYGF